MAILPTLYLRKNSKGLYQLVIYPVLCSLLGFLIVKNIIYMQDCDCYEEIDEDNTFGLAFNNQIYLEKPARYI